MTSFGIFKKSAKLNTVILGFSSFKPPNLPEQLSKSMQKTLRMTAIIGICMATGVAGNGMG